MKAYLKLLARYLKPHWPQVVLLAVLLFSGVGLQLVNPQLMRYFIDAVTTGGSLRILVMAAGIFIGVALVQQIIAVSATYVSQNLGWTSTNTLRSDLLAHCLKLDMTFHKANRPGELIERIDGDVTAMFEFFSNLLVELVSHLILVLGVLVLMYLEDWRLGLAMTFFVAFALFVMMRFNAFAVPRQIAVREIVTKFYGFLGEVFGNTEDIRSNGAVGKIIQHYRESIRAWLPKQRKATTAGFTTWFSVLAFIAIGNALAFGIGGILWSKGLITLGTVYLIFHYTEMLSMPLRNIQRQLLNLQKAGASVERVEKLLSTESRIKDGKGAELPEGALTVEIDSLTFEYEEGLPVLENLSLKIEPGKVLGVLGRTGSGKTTLARLLIRFYDPKSGEIRLNGRGIMSVPLKDLRERIAFVTQDVQLFNASVRANLTFFNSAIDDARIWQALREIGLADWVNSLPNGLDTILASDGGGLSAGEAQLLAFVRVFLKDPGLIILDEASSRLDPMTEQLMEGAISKLFKGRTGIIIAHRLQTIERADEVVILEQGKIREYGNRMLLANDNSSYFAHLLQKGIEEVLA